MRRVAWRGGGLHNIYITNRRQVHIIILVSSSSSSSFTLGGPDNGRFLTNRFPIDGFPSTLHNGNPSANSFARQSSPRFIHSPVSRNCHRAAETAAATRAVVLVWTQRTAAVKRTGRRGEGRAEIGKGYLHSE